MELLIIPVILEAIVIFYLIKKNKAVRDLEMINEDLHSQIGKLIFLYELEQKRANKLEETVLKLREEKTQMINKIKGVVKTLKTN